VSSENTGDSKEMRAQTKEEEFSETLLKSIEKALQDFLNKTFLDEVLSNLRQARLSKQAQQPMMELTYKLNGVEPGYCYLFESHELSFQTYANLTKAGIPGLCITRDDPEEVKKTYGLKEGDIMLLSSRPLKGFKALSTLQEVSLIITQYLQDNICVVLLDGLEYLITRFGFNAVYKMIQEKRFNFLEANANLLIPLELETLTQQEKALLLSEIKLKK